MNRWHKAPNRLADPAYMMLTAAARGVLAGLTEKLAAQPCITANVSVWANWLGLDRRIVRDAFEAIAESGILPISSEVKGKAGTFYTVGQPLDDTSATTPRPHGDPAATPSRVPDKSSIDAGLPSDSLNRVDKKRVDNTPLPPEGDEVNLLPDPPKRTPKAKTEPGRFEEFWAAYPKKTGKEPARQAWTKLNPDDALAGLILAAVGKAKGTRDWTKDGGQYVPMASTFLNQKRWQDFEVATNLVSFPAPDARPWQEWLDERRKFSHVDYAYVELHANKLNHFIGAGLDARGLSRLCEEKGIEACWPVMWEAYQEALKRKQAERAG